MIWADDRPQIRAVCFDGFGTLVEIGDKRRPFRALLGHASASAAVTQALTTPMSLRDLARDLAIVPDEERLIELEADLSAETASTRLRPEIEAIWRRLGELGLKIGVCSNLAAPYGAALLGCLPSAPDAAVLSFEVGMMKPQVEIYQLVCQRLNLEPHQVLFVGDSIDADVIGPRNTGLFAMHIDEFESGFTEGAAPEAPKPVIELLERAAATPRRA
ncbi:HAD family hydrolase [Bosea sp. NBC_00550]|uniref:HAD family hydrolase n=1 Tax=Bosea sp. NBC_00550 TaxID=2969621 RepID=UPI002F3E57A5